MENEPVAAPTGDPDELLDQPQVRQMLGWSEFRLRQARREEGLPYIRVGHRTVRIRRRDLDAWLDGRRVVEDRAS